METTNEPTATRGKEPSLAVQSERQDERSVSEWLTSLPSADSVQIKLARVAPQTFRGRKVNGHLATFSVSEMIDEEEIRDRFGGGKLQLVAQRRGTNGRWEFMKGGSRTIDIVGDPKLSAELFDVEETGGKAAQAIPSGEDPGLAKSALALSERLVERAEERAERAASRDGSMDIDRMMRPYEKQIEIMQEQNRMLSVELQQIRGVKPDDSPTTKLVEKMMDSESVRLEGLRQQMDGLRANHDAELRQLRQSHEDDMKRREDHFRRQEQEIRNANTREIDTIKEGQRMTFEAQKTAHEGRIDTFKSRVTDLERQLSETRVELVELRSKKDKSITEQITEFAHIKEAIETLGGNNDNDSSTIERVLGAISDNPVVQGIANRISNAPAVHVPPQRVVRRGPPRQAAPPPNALKPTTPPAPAQPVRKVIQINQNELRMALSFIESAATREDDPEKLAQGARSMIPTDILRAIRECGGIDTFLDNVAQLEESSVLNTQGGRNYIRKVYEHLSKMA